MESEQRACSSKKLGGHNETQVRDELKEVAHAGVGSGSSYGLRTAERLKRIFALKFSAPRVLLDSEEQDGRLVVQWWLMWDGLRQWKARAS